MCNSTSLVKLKYPTRNNITKRIYFYLKIPLAKQSLSWRTPSYLDIMKAMLAFLTLVVASNSTNTQLFNNQETQCSNNNDCPTWFICNKQNNCECGDRHQGRIACDNNTQISAVLECNCVTYDGEIHFLDHVFTVGKAILVLPS